MGVKRHVLALITTNKVFNEKLLVQNTKKLKPTMQRRNKRGMKTERKLKENR